MNEEDKRILANIKARLASEATRADVRRAVQAFEDGFKELEATQ